MAILLVEHDVELVMRICADIYVLDFGEVIAHGTPAQVQADGAVQDAYLGIDTSKGPFEIELDDDMEPVQ